MRFRLNWDMSSVDFDAEGTYTITGQAKLTEYPVLNGRADPDIFKYNGKYYFIATGETQSQSQVCIREADTPLGLFTAQDHELIPNVGKPRWAPELHEINGKLYIFLAIGDAWKQGAELCHGVKRRRQSDGKGRLGRSCSSDKSGRKCSLYSDGITLDMTYFEAGRRTLSVLGTACDFQSSTELLIFGLLRIDPDNPYQTYQ